MSFFLPRVHAGGDKILHGDRERKREGFIAVRHSPIELAIFIYF